MVKSKLEKILETYEGYDWEASLIFTELECYLKEYQEDLTLEQYKSIRSWVDKSYKILERQGLRTGQLHKEQTSDVGHLFTDFLRYHHYRLLDNLGKIPVVEKEKIGFFGRAYSKVKKVANNIQYKNNWKKKDDEMYSLERGLYTNEICSCREKELIDNLPSNITFYKRKTFAILSKASRYLW